MIMFGRIDVVRTAWNIEQTNKLPWNRCCWDLKYDYWRRVGINDGWRPGALCEQGSQRQSQFHQLALKRHSFSWGVKLRWWISHRIKNIRFRSDRYSNGPFVWNPVKQQTDYRHSDDYYHFYDNTIVCFWMGCFWIDIEICFTQCLARATARARAVSNECNNYLKTENHLSFPFAYFTFETMTTTMKKTTTTSMTTTTMTTTTTLRQP